MEPADARIPDTGPATGDFLGIGHSACGKKKDEAGEVERFKNCVHEIIGKVDELEQRVNEVTLFYSSLSKKQSGNSKGGSVMKEKEKEKQIVSIKKQQQDAAKREAASAKRQQELMRQFTTIFRQEIANSWTSFDSYMTAHKWSWPFMHPVDVEGLGLHDYHQVIEKPMDLNKIKNQMEAKDGTGYKNIRDIYADVRLVFKNAMLYNEERSDVHVMAKTLLDKFEEKWLQLLPKVVEEEARRKEEEAEAQLNMQLAQEAAHAKSARDINNELFDVQMHLEELRDMVIQKCRKMTVEEKRKLGSGLSHLSPEDLNKALEIIAERNSNFQPTADVVNVDIDALSEWTLWKLKFFVKEALEANKGKGSATKVGMENSKRKREICEALAKTARKRSKKPPS